MNSPNYTRPETFRRQQNEAVLTLYYERPKHEKQAFPFLSFQGEELVESGNFHQAISSFDDWEAFACHFDNILSFDSLAALTGRHVEKGGAE